MSFSFKDISVNLRKCYSTSRHNYKNEMLRRVKVIVIFVGDAFSLFDLILYVHQQSFS